MLRGVGTGTPFDTMRDRELPALNPADRALAYELSAGVLRRQRRLDAALAPLVQGKWNRLPRDLKTVLRLGAYQLWHLDRVPAYAAVATSVSLAREVTTRKSAGLVNAVLRRFADRPPPPSDDSQDPGALAFEHSSPEWLVKRWQQSFGLEGARAILEWNDTVPELYLQPLRGDASALADHFRTHGIAAEEAPFGAGVRVTGGSPTDLPGYGTGAWLAQDPAQALALRFANFPADAVIYDACAAPGAKAAQLARMGHVVAGDRSRTRVHKLRTTLGQAGVEAAVIVADASAPPLDTVDAVLLDAPCSGTGTMRRHPDARHRLRPKLLAAAVAQQAALLESVAKVVRPGGLLVYVTCSLEPEENQHQVAGFLERHPEFVRRPGQNFETMLTKDGDLQLLPQVHGTDGAYAARLERRP